MNIKLLLLPVFFSMVLVNPSSNVQAQAFIDAETGAVFTGYNNVRIPGNTGTSISLKKDLDPNTAAFIRLRAGYTFNSRHTFSVLYAPLQVKSDGSVNRPVFFEGVTFPSNTPLNSTYRFNSYRLTYRYDIVKKPNFEFGLGLTGKIRDAEISLRSPAATASKTNVGFVPLINFRLNWKIGEKYGILIDGDALAAPQGRAEDVQIAGTYKMSNKLMLRLGYRLLEGGADNDEVYNFALFHYGSVGLTYTFKK